MLNRLGTTWDERYGELLAFKAREGHCNVPAHDPVNAALGGWLDRQRQSKRRGTLSAEHTARLDALGVWWEPRQSLWDEMCQALIAFKARHGYF